MEHTLKTKQRKTTLPHFTQSRSGEQILQQRNCYYPRTPALLPSLLDTQTTMYRSTMGSSNNTPTRAPARTLTKHAARHPSIKPILLVVLQTGQRNRFDRRRRRRRLDQPSATTTTTTTRHHSQNGVAHLNARWHVHFHHVCTNGRVGAGLWACVGPRCLLRTWWVRGGRRTCDAVGLRVTRRSLHATALLSTSCACAIVQGWVHIADHVRAVGCQCEGHMRERSQQLRVQRLAPKCHVMVNIGFRLGHTNTNTSTSTSTGRTGASRVGDRRAGLLLWRRDRSEHDHVAFIIAQQTATKRGIACKQLHAAVDVFALDDGVTCIGVFLTGASTRQRKRWRRWTRGDRFGQFLVRRRPRQPHHRELGTWAWRR